MIYNFVEEYEACSIMLFHNLPAKSKMAAFKHCIKFCINKKTNKFMKKVLTFIQYFVISPFIFNTLRKRFGIE